MFVAKLAKELTPSDDFEARSGKLADNNVLRLNVLPPFGEARAC